MTPRVRLTALFAAASLCAGAFAITGAFAADSTTQVDRPTAAGMTGTYTVAVTGAAANGCHVTLNGPTMHDLPDGPWSVTVNARCRAFPGWRTITQWMPTGGASVRFLGGKPMHTLGEFSPVQDASGVYLRGAIDGDDRLFELRPVAG